MAKGRKTAAMLGLLGAGALAARAVPPSPVNSENPDRDAILEEAKRKYGFSGAMKYLSSPYRIPTDYERDQNRKKAYEAEPGLRGTLRTEDYQPVLSGTGMSVRSGMKKGGKVSASSRGDGIAQRGKTRGKMV